MIVKIISIFILFLIAQSAYAETKIFSGKVVTDTDKVIDGNAFRFTYDENSKKAFVQTPAGGLIVENGACKPNNVFKVCINRANFSHKNITTYVYYYEIDTTIYKLTGSLSTSSKATLSSLLQGESTELTITITNPTDFDITNIILSYDLTPFYVDAIKGCELNGNQILWKGSLQTKYDKTCSLTITANKEGKYSLSGNLSYFNGFENEKETTNATVITVLPKQLKVSQSVDKNIEVRKPFYFNISLQNIHPSEDMNGLSTITLPSHVSLIKDTPAFEKSARVLQHNLMLKPGAGMNYSLYMEKLSEGKEPINSRFAYTIKGINDIMENSTFVDIISTQPVNKPAETKAEKEKSNELTNLTAVKDVHDFQAIGENKTSEAKLESENKTIEQVTVTDAQKPKLFNKNILLLSIIIFAAFLAVLFIINRIRKRKKVYTEVEEKALKEISEAAQQTKQNQNIFKPNS